MECDFDFFFVLGSMNAPSVQGLVLLCVLSEIAGAGPLSSPRCAPGLYGQSDLRSASIHVGTCAP